MSKWKKWVAAYDVHGDMQDKDSVSAFFKFCDRYKPDIRILGGDLFDLRPLRKGASADEQRESMHADINKGHNFFDRFQPTQYLLGNHEYDRLWEIAEAGRGPVSDLCQYGVKEITKKCASAGCVLFPYDRTLGVYQQGDTAFIHGSTHGVSAVAAAINTYCVRGNLIMGHIHREEYRAASTIDPRWGIASPCLCQLNMRYLHKCLNAFKHSNGWVYGVYDPKSGANVAWVAKKLGTKWLLPTGVEEL